MEKHTEVASLPPPWPGTPMSNGQAPKRGPSHRKYKRWEVVTLITVTPVIAFFALIGVDTFVHHWTDPHPVRTVAGSAPTPASSHKATPKPTVTYDLDGYTKAITGHEAQAFTDAVNQMNADVGGTHSNLLAAGIDAPKLNHAATEWIDVLMPTNPPPTYRTGKQTYISAAKYARRAAWWIQAGLRSANFSKINKGTGYLSQAMSLLPHSGS